MTSTNFNEYLQAQAYATTEDDDGRISSHNTAVSPRHSGENVSITSVADLQYEELFFEQSCGWRKCKPKKLQKLNSPKWFLFFLAVFSVVQDPLKMSESHSFSGAVRVLEIEHWRDMGYEAMKNRSSHRRCSVKKGVHRNFAIFRMIINGFTNVGLSTLEKQFKLNSKESGMIVAAKEISSLLLIAFLSYYGSFGHKPKYLGYGALLTSFGSLLYVLPHGLTGKHIPDKMSGLIKNQEVCSVLATFNETVHEARCELLGTSEWYYVLIFIIAKMLVGAGTAPLFTLGAAYIDENVHPKVSPIYLGIWYVCTSFGPGIGFVAGGSLLTVYVDLIQPAGIDLTPDDPQWVGAWWLGHFFGGIVIFLSSCALLAYPRSMPGAQARRMQAMREGTIQPADIRIRGKLKDIIPATTNLLKNPTFIFNTLALSSGTIISTGLGPFVVKYLTAQFDVSTMKAGVASGITLIPGTAGGIFIGSFLMRRLKGKSTCIKAAKYCFYFQLIAVLSVASFLIPGCNSPRIAGVNMDYYNGSNNGQNLTATCNVNCICESVQFNPVCGLDNITYFSPCHLGCIKKISKTEFGECSCVSPDLLLEKPSPNYNASVNFTTSLHNIKTPVVAENGSCDRDCKNFIPFLCGIVVLLVLNFVNVVPAKLVVMRCVPDNERAYALGLQWIVLTLLGSMPGPVLFGVFIDRTCELWETTCQGQGNCLVYDNKILSYRLAAAILLFQVLATISYFISWKAYKPPRVTFADDITQFPIPYTEREQRNAESSTLTSLSEQTWTSALDMSESIASTLTSKLLLDKVSDASNIKVNTPKTYISYESGL